MRLLYIIILSMVCLVVIPSYASTTITDTLISTPNLTVTGICSGCNTGLIIPDYFIYKNSTDGLFYEQSNAQKVLMKSQNTTDAAAVIQDAWNRVNNTVSSTGTGGWTDVACGTYPIRHELEIPALGNLTFTGHGIDCTVFTVPTGQTNNFAALKHARTTDSFFNYFAHFKVNNQGFINGSNTGFSLNSTGHGIHDTVFEDIFIDHFGNDNMNMSAYNTWNVKLDKMIFENAGHAELFANAGQNLRVTDSKFLFAHGDYAVIFNQTSSSTFLNNFFFQNDKSDIDIRQNATFNIISDNVFVSGSNAGSGKGDAVDLTFAYGNKISNNQFWSPNDNYYINLSGAGGKIKFNYVGGNEMIPPAKIRNILIFFSNNIVQQTNYIQDNAGYNIIGVTSTRDPAKQAVLSIDDRATRYTQYNMTLPTVSGTAIEQIGNFTSDALALPSGTNHYCVTYLNTANSTYRSICNLNNVIHVLAKQ